VAGYHVSFQRTSAFCPTEQGEEAKALGINVPTQVAMNMAPNNTLFFMILSSNSKTEF
jgi:hypothetical protein